jgi:hypothetical protein
VLAAPIASRAESKKHTSVVTTGSPKTTRPSLRNGFNGFLRALPGDRAFLPPSSVKSPTNLTPASGCQDHTPSPSAGNIARLASYRVHRIPRPTFVTIAKRPSCGQRNGGKIPMISDFPKEKYVCAQIWTTQITMISLTKLAFARTWLRPVSIRYARRTRKNRSD